jgi:hypothetical protein
MKVLGIFMNGIKHTILNELPRSRAVEISKKNLFSIDASIGVLNSFIPKRCAIGIRSTSKFQCASLLKFESHE